MHNSPFPSIGTKAVHKDDYAKTSGPVWEVYGHETDKERIVNLKPAEHKLNNGLAVVPKNVPLKEFQDDYKLL